MAEPAYNKLPRAVRAQAEAADRIVGELQEGFEPETPDTPEEPEPLEQAAEAPPASSPNEDVPPKAEDAPFNEATATAEELRAELAKERHRHNTLKGKYRAEVPRYARQVRELKADIRDLEERLSERDGRISDLEQRGRAEAPAADDARHQMGNHPSYLAIAEDLGDDVAQHLLTLAKDIAGGAQAPQPSAPSPDTGAAPNAGDGTPAGNLPAAQQQNANIESEIAAFVDSVLGDGMYNAIDADDAFQEWLNQHDLREGKTRRESLQQLFRAGDIHRCAGFWTDWAERKASAPAPADPRQELADDVSPTGGEPGLPAGPNPIRESAIAAFYKDVSLGKFKGREAEKLVREKEIFAAIESGAVIPG